MGAPLYARWQAGHPQGFSTRDGLQQLRIDLHGPGHLRNVAKVNDPILTDLLVRQRRIQDLAARRRLIHDVQRQVAVQQYIAEIYSPATIFVGDGVVKNYGPNLGYDYGGRLLSAWLDR